MLKAAKQKARIALTVEYFIFGFLFSTLLSRFPAISDKYNLTEGQLSLVPLCMSIGSLLFMPVCGYLISKYGSKRLSVTGFLQFSIFALFAIAPNIYFLYAFCLFYGMAVGCTDVAVNANSLIIERAYKRPIISLFHAFFYVGMAGGSLLSILFLIFNAPIEVHFPIVAAISIITYGIGRLYFLKETPLQSLRVPKGKILFPKGLLLLIAAIAFCGRIVEGGIADWSTVYMNNIVKLTAVYAPIGLTIYAVFLSIGRFFGDSIRSTLGDNKTLLYSCLVTSVGLAIMIATPYATFTIIGLFVGGLGLANVVPIIYSLSGKATPNNPGVGLATVNTLSGTGFLFGPAVIGFIAEHYSLRVSFGYILALCLVMSYLAYRYMTAHRK